MGAKAEVTPVANWRDVTRFMAWTLGICFLMLALVWAWSETTHFLMMDSRFVLAIPELGEESKGIIVDGVKNANRTTIATLFSDDYGRSIYRIPIAERRRRLLGLNWIEEARVSRVWPNQLHIDIRERKPAAFLQVPASSDRPGHPALIDANGVIMEQEIANEFPLPVMTGILNKHSLEDRRLRVHKLQKLMEDSGPHAKKISEIDVSDPDNIRVMMEMKDRAVTLILGDRHYRQRIEGFLSYFEDVSRRAPDSSIFDLRLEDRITVVPVSIDQKESDEDSSVQ